MSNNEVNLSIINNFLKVLKSMLQTMTELIENRAIEIGNHIKDLHKLGSDHKNEASKIFEEIYINDKDMKQISEKVNTSITKIFNEASLKKKERNQKENLSDVNSINKVLTKYTKNLNLKLENLETEHETLISSVTPLIVSLQFHDALRQRAERCIHAIDYYKNEFELTSDKNKAENLVSLGTNLLNCFREQDEFEIISKICKVEIKEDDDNEEDDVMLF